jgi:hypothetical protein
MKAHSRMRARRRQLVGLLAPGCGLGSQADYERSGHVVDAVVGDIAGWIAGKKEAQP